MATPYENELMKDPCEVADRIIALEASVQELSERLDLFSSKVNERFNTARSNLYDMERTLSNDIRDVERKVDGRV